MSWLINKFKAKEPTPVVEETNTQEQQPEEESSSITSILKSVLSAASLGSDVLAAGISLPCSLYEPLSILQRQIELMEYSELLDLAANAENSVERLAFVTAFATSVYPSTERYFTDFNPILGETFEFIDEEKNLRCVSEQVSHHPPISAIHIEGANWVFWQNSAASTSFQGNSIEIDTHGKTHIYFPQSKDHFYYTNPKTKVHNLIIGKMWVEHFGELTITNLKNQDNSTLTFKKAGFFGSCNYKVTGTLKSKGQNMVDFEGVWNEHLNATWKNGESQNLWTVADDNLVNNKYAYTRFTEKLLDMNDEMNSVLPPTDSRLRCDRMLLENGETSRATRVKRTMEDRQRADKKARIENGEEWVPNFFHNIPEENGGDIWVYCGDYWEQRDEKLNLYQNGVLSEDLLNGGSAATTAADFRNYDL